MDESTIDVGRLVDALRREHDAAESEWENIRDAQDLAQRFYEAKPFGNEVTGRSQIILPDVQETIDYMAVSVLRTFVSGDRVVEFEATNEEDEALADEATAAIGYNFMRQQDGYRILHDWCVSGLLDRYGVAKTMATTEERVIRERVQISDPVELEGFQGEVEEADPITDEMGQIAGYQLLLKSERSEKRFIDQTIPPDEFRFSPRARHEDDADYLAHVCAKTRSEMVAMGFARDQVYSLPAHNHIPERQDDYDHWHRAESTPALEEVLLCEEYARIDIDDDGIAERVTVFRVENDILRWQDGSLAIETVEEQPFSVFCPFPRPNRMVGWSLADKVMDIQLARSTVARQLLDGMYNANMPRPIVDINMAADETMDDILSPVPGSPIRVRGGAASVQPYQTGFDVGRSLSVMEWMTGERESRTGITRLNQGLDADTLNKTATGTALMQAQGQQQEEFIARNLGEAFSRLVAKKYRLMRREGEPFRIKVDGQYKEVDPRNWPEEVNVTIRVGLGTGSKDKRIQARMMLAPILAEGFQNKQVTAKHLFNAFDGLVRDLGIGTGDKYWIDPDAPDAPQERPDPAMLAMQAEQQREDAKLQLEAQKAEAKAQSDRDMAAAKIELMREESAAKLELEREKSTAEAQMNMERMAFEQNMAERQAIFNERLAERQAEHAARQAEAKISANRPGGDLDK